GKTKELKKSMMAELFKYGAPSFRKGRNLKKTEIGEIPEDWKVVRLGEIIEIFDSKRIPLSEKERQKMKGKYPYCGANGIIDYINDYIFKGEYVLLAEDGGYWGPFEQSTYIMNGKFWVNNHAHVLKALEERASNFYLMNILTYLDLSDYISGTTRGKLNQDTMKRIKIPLPSLSEQREIAEILQTIDEKIEIEEKKKALYEELFKTMLNKLMSGEIDVEKF
ncbi:MAG: restriction endonuclease subunit S, partial [Candidatus Pacebacteria bacterium]|nr:restriction endonuclease subunit S [Candidatus Paceibacterota bacterium]